MVNKILPSSVESAPFVEVGTLAKCVVVLCLVRGENTEESGAALRDQVLRELRKIWFRNVAVVEVSLWGCCFVFSPSSQVAKGVQGLKGKR